MKKVGELNERITVEQFVVSGKDGFGQEQGEWQAVATVWAKVTPQTAQEQARQDRVQTTATYQIKIRQRGDITEKMQVVWRSRTLHIGSVVDDFEDDATIITATEGR